MMEPSLDDLIGIDKFIGIIEAKSKKHETNFKPIETLYSEDDANELDLQARRLERHIKTCMEGGHSGLYEQRNNIIYALRKRIVAGVNYEQWENFFNAALSYDRASNSSMLLRWNNVSIHLIKRTIAIYKRGLAEPLEPEHILWLHGNLAKSYYHSGKMDMATSMAQLCLDESNKSGTPLTDVTPYHEVLGLLSKRTPNGTKTQALKY